MSNDKYQSEKYKGELEVSKEESQRLESAIKKYEAPSYSVKASCMSPEEILRLEESGELEDESYEGVALRFNPDGESETPSSDLEERSEWELTNEGKKYFPLERSQYRD